MFRGIARFVLTLAAVGLLAAPAAQVLAQQHGKIRLAYSSAAPGSDSTFLFAGHQLGFFREQGIELDIQIAGGGVAATGFVASGAADLGLGSIESLPGYVLKGVPMRAIYLYSYRPIFKLAFFDGSKAQKIADLKGARVGVLSAGSGSVLVLQFLLKEAGLSPKDVELVPLGVGAAAANAVKAGQIDALIYHETFFPFLEANGIVLRYYSSPSLERGFAGQAIYGLEKTLSSRRPAVEAFLRGLTKSLEYATKNPAAATKAFAQLHPEIGRNLAVEEKAWRERMKSSYPVAGQWGAMDDTAWTNLLDVLQAGGMIKDRPPVAKLYTNEFLKAANSVDLSKMP